MSLKDEGHTGSPAQMPLPMTQIENGELARLREIERAEYVNREMIQYHINRAELPLDTADEGQPEMVGKIVDELFKAQAENAKLRELWTEARAVVIQSRDANCLISYGAAQCNAVEAANKWLNKMPT